MTKVLVILSGGQDSTTCLFWAKERFDKVHAITINYGQKHRIEIESAIMVAQIANIKNHEIIEVGSILKGTSPLVNSDIEVGTYDSIKELPKGIEPTFIPGRNPLFWVIATNRAACLGIRDIVAGVCEADFAGYHDCRQNAVNWMANAMGVNIYNDSHAFLFHTPLMFLTKKETVFLAQKLGKRCMEALKYSHTCYNGVFPPCGQCHACLLRKRGFNEAGIVDPLYSRVERQGKLFEKVEHV